MIWVFQGYHFYAVWVFDVAANRNNNYFLKIPQGRHDSSCQKLLRLHDTAI